MKYMENRFDYAGAVAQLEELVSKAENPDTGIDDIVECIDKADALVKKCREYLRSAREKLDTMDSLK